MKFKIIDCIVRQRALYNFFKKAGETRKLINKQDGWGPVSHIHVISCFCQTSQNPVNACCILDPWVHCCTLSMGACYYFVFMASSWHCGNKNLRSSLFVMNSWWILLWFRKKQDFTWTCTENWSSPTHRCPIKPCDLRSFSSLHSLSFQNDVYHHVITRFNLQINVPHLLFRNSPKIYAGRAIMNSSLT